MPLSSAPLRPLPPIAARVDNALADMDGEVDWLLALSPIDNEAMWHAFADSGYRWLPELKYIDLEVDLREVRERLHAMPVDEVESPLLSALLAEKRRELERQVELVRLRGTDGFLNASLDLFGGVDAPLLECAEAIMRDVRPGAPLKADAGIDDVLEAVEAERDWYRESQPGFDFDVVVDTDLNSMMMVSHGTFYVDGDVRLPHARVQPLVQHEIGTHVVTRHNGGRQPLRQLQVGLAHYDPLQEGLGVLAEYLAGFLPGERLLVLAARVIATDMAMNGHGVPEIFDLLHNTHGMATDDAFDVAVRALRGGGLTKDAVYLGGLRDLLDSLADGADLADLYAGKFALSHLAVLGQLAEEGWVGAPQVLPRFFHHPGFAERLECCRSISVAQLHHEVPVA
ncbi:DUF1704 domain-containing protein [Lysobacter sp. GX 14042]|uniref:tyrosine/phenylalanine carboxypeptidase domain-containing protein n=1 Tax=Lysobacter sp. GX 14042 TaxID=2907155 RepID=UPI001F3F174C|nr:DUF1704 domain-containing protein [Lysobacter sp. GX 14042]